MLGRPFSSPGYHSTVAAGTWTHPTRQSFDYAAALLARNAAGDADRAAEVIRKLLTLQDTDPASRTYGIWPWLMEEPLAKMSPPDWNWADFCGARIAQMLVDDRAKLPEDLAADDAKQPGPCRPGHPQAKRGADLHEHRDHGRRRVRRRGRVARRRGVLDYGRRRLQKVVEHTAHHGSFNEYNSPTYTLVASGNASGRCTWSATRPRARRPNRCAAPRGRSSPRASIPARSNGPARTAARTAIVSRRARCGSLADQTGARSGPTRDAPRRGRRQFRPAAASAVSRRTGAAVPRAAERSARDPRRTFHARQDAGRYDPRHDLAHGRRLPGKRQSRDASGPSGGR